MVAGRPRTHDRIAIGKAFVQWVKDHPDCLTVPHFTTANNIDTEMLIRWRKDDPEFRQYYIEAKDLIGINRLKANQNELLDKQIYLMHARNFDSDIKADWREEKEFEASLKNDVQEKTFPHMVINADLAAGASADVPAKAVPEENNTSS